MGQRAQHAGGATGYSGLRHSIPSRDEGDKLLREMTQARERAANGDSGERARFERLRNRVCAAHLRFAVTLSKRYGPRRGRLEFEDLMQFAALGLMRACETFEPSCGVAFSTYSANWVRQYVGRGIANYARIIRAPVHLQEARARSNRAAAKFVAATGRVARADELATLTGLSPAVVARVLANPPEVLTLDAPLFHEPGETAIDNLPSDGPTPLEALLAKERAEYARASLEALPNREREVVERHTIDGEMTLEEIGANMAVERTGRLGLSRERVRQIEHDALGMLRRRAEATARAERALRRMVRKR